MPNEHTEGCGCAGCIVQRAEALIKDGGSLLVGGNQNPFNWSGMTTSGWATSTRTPVEDFAAIRAQMENDIYSRRGIPKGLLDVPYEVVDNSHVKVHVTEIPVPINMREIYSGYLTKSLFDEVNRERAEQPPQPEPKQPPRDGRRIIMPKKE